MKTKNSRYLSYRIAWISILMFTIMMVLLLTLTMFAVQEGKHWFIVACGYVSLIAIAYAYYKWIVVPYKQSSKVLHLFVTGYTIRDLIDQPVSLSPEIDEITKKVQELMDTGELVNATKKQAEYLALQNQINPHFLYNTLEGIRGETLNAGLENVAKMTEALATFFRYTISNVENLVTLEDELMNVNNYYIIQKYRFNDRIHLTVEYDSTNEMEAMLYKIPKLTLQPIIENSIYHGIERNIGIGKLRIKIQTTTKRLIITVSDNGVGMTEERLQEINDRLRRTSLDYINPDTKTQGGIAIVNVNNRIKLLFGEEYGINVYSALNVGTDVEITFPLIKNSQG